MGYANTKKHFCWFLGCFLFAFIANAQNNKVDFHSRNPIPIYLIGDMFIQNTQIQRIASRDVVFSKMELLAISPASIDLARGKYLLNVGGPGDFNKTVILDLEEGNKTVDISGNKQAMKTFGYATALSSLFLVASIPGFMSDNKPFGIYRIVTTGVTVLTIGFTIGWTVNLPRVVIR